MTARRKQETPEEPNTAPGASQSAVKKAATKGFTRAVTPPADIEVAPAPAGEVLRAASATSAGQIATGRGPTYEWEFFMQDMETRMATVESGGGGGSTGSYVHTQTLASASWAVNHALNTKPSVVVVDGGGQELLAEVHYPDDNTTVIIFGSPYAGTAYLRG